MKLCRIEHVRCAEVQAYTFAWVPDEWDEDDVSGALNRAYTAHLEALRVKDHPDQPVYPGGRESWMRRHPDMLVKDALVGHAAEINEYNRLEAQRRKSKQGLWASLRAEGFIGLTSGTPAFTQSIDWGHRHGVDVRWEADVEW